jgi:hypothetical protein
VSKVLVRRLVDKIRDHMAGMGALHFEGSMAYLCYITGADGFGYNANAIPNLTEWERGKLKELLNLFRPTPNELIALDKENGDIYEIRHFYSNLRDEPIMFNSPWFGYYGDKNAPMRDYAFWLILAMLEDEAK